jgi:L-aspartate oxidase
MSEHTRTFDFVVLGSGIAGLTFALKVAPHGRVAIITKKDRAESNTNYAQGGIAAVTSKEDSVEIHVRDTLEAGAGLCREQVVRTIVQEGPARITELIELGMKFSEREIPAMPGTRELDLGKEGGHSKRRILHAKDVTGREIEKALLTAVASEPAIEIFENHLAIDLITSRKLGQGENSARANPIVARGSTRSISALELCTPLRAPSYCWPPVVAARFTFIPPIPTSPPAMAWRWRIARAPSWPTWSSSNSIPPAFTIRAPSPF